MAVLAHGSRPGEMLPWGKLERELAQGVGLVVTRDDSLLLNCTIALEELGFEVVTAYSPMTAEYRLRRHKVRMIVLDARILGPVCRERPGPILPAAARMPFVLTNASCLGTTRRRLVTSYRAKCVEDSEGRKGLVRVVAEALSESVKLDFVETERGEHGTIFLVHKDNGFRRWLAEALRNDGHSVSEYGAPSEVPAGSFGEAAIVVSEYQMGGEDGLAFADQYHAACPSIPVIMITAHWEQKFVGELSSREFLYYLRKPLDYSVLHGVLRDLTRSVRDSRPASGGYQ